MTSRTRSSPPAADMRHPPGMGRPGTPARDTLRSPASGTRRSRVRRTCHGLAGSKPGTHVRAMPGMVTLPAIRLLPIMHRRAMPLPIMHRGGMPLPTMHRGVMPLPIMHRGVIRQPSMSRLVTPLPLMPRRVTRSAGIPRPATPRPATPRPVMLRRAAPAPVASRSRATGSCPRGEACRTAPRGQPRSVPGGHGQGPPAVTRRGQAIPAPGTRSASSPHGTSRRQRR
jgi:hypothetical protein